MNNISDDKSASDTPHVLDCVRKGFNSASNYEKVRQDYPIEAVEFLLQKLGLLDNNTAASARRDAQLTVLELGSGTGKYTRVMLEVLKEQNVRVIASDPLENMCEHFRHLQPGIEIIQCSAENISLPDASVNAVLASQSFHWFSNSTALQEIHRVLVPGGSFGLVWALTDTSVPWISRIREFMTSLYEETAIWPDDEAWKNVFNLTPQKLFSDLEENSSFRLNLPSSFDDAYKFFTSFSVLNCGSESTKESFRELFDQVTREHFKDKGITLDLIPFKILMYWCNKLTQA